MLRGNRELIKAMNRSLLLNVIRREGELSRTQLTEISGLSVGAVSNIINELLQQQWILAAGEGDYTGGRRQTPLRLNPAAGYAIGMKLMEDRVVSAVTDFEATVLGYFEHEFLFDEDPTQLAALLAQVIEASVAQSGLAAERFLGAGIGLAGIIDAQQGIVRHSPFFGWRDVALTQLVEQQTHLPIFVENDVNTLTITEQLFGAGRHHHNFIVVTVGRGIGMGMVINGQLYQGSRGGVGELGRTVIDGAWAGEAYATLEAVAADPAVVGALTRASATDAVRYATLAEVVAAAEAGNDAAQAELARSGTHLGTAIANVINVTAPDLVIISGEGVAAGAYRLDATLAALRAHSFDGLAERVEVVIRPTDDRAWAQGAASLVLSKVFASPVRAAGVG